MGAQLQSAAVSSQPVAALTPEPDFPSIHSSFHKGQAEQIASKTEADELVVIDDQEHGEAGKAIVSQQKESKTEGDKLN
ncbi:MAG: hypothetical protein ACPIOQ_25875 [Promethearchaeia archaeon]